jgi:hypothetical protein
MVFIFLFILIFSQNVMALIPPRRVDTVSTKPGYIVVPVYTQVPGIGSGYGVGLLDSNIAGTRTNLSAAGLLGNFNVGIIDLANIHLTEFLTIQITSYYTKLTYKTFDRGTFSSNTTYFSPLKTSYGAQSVLRVRFWEGRIQFLSHLGPSKLQTSQIYDSAGDNFINSDATFSDTVTSTISTKLDLTDSSADPREGLRLEAGRRQELIFDQLHSQFYVLNLSATGYIPIGRSTLVTNYFRSAAFVFQQNYLSSTQLQAGMGFQCANISDANLSARCQTAENQRVQDRVTENNYGTAAALGGTDRMRGFVQSRYRGSQVQFWGSEFRFNFSDEGKPFDIGFVKGVRSNFQLALFYELGGVSDPPLPVEQAPPRSTYGAGLRLLFSGLTIRADMGLAPKVHKSLCFLVTRGKVLYCKTTRLIYNRLGFFI